MNITHLRYAVEVARTGSISQAAENLAVGQPNLSKALKDLETGLGVTLFTRTSKGAVPTPQGRSFLQHARALLTRLDEMERLFAADTSRAALHIAATPSAVLNEALAAAAGSLPADAALTLTPCDTAQVLRAVSEGAATFGILRAPDNETETLIRRGEERGLSLLPLRHTLPTVLMSVHHPLVNSRPLLFLELAPFVRLSGGEPAPLLAASQVKRSAPLPEAAPAWELPPTARLAVLAARPDTYCFDEPLPRALLDRYGLCARTCVGVEREWVDWQVLPAGQAPPPAAEPLLDTLAALWHDAAGAITA